MEEACAVQIRESVVIFRIKGQARLYRKSRLLPSAQKHVYVFLDAIGSAL